MKDLLVSIPSRSRLTQLYDMVRQLYDTCASLDNFDLQIVIDEDQQNLYKPIFFDYPDIIETVVPYAGHWQNIFIAQHEQILREGQYFLWVLPDDMRGLTKDWDTAILDQGKVFDDDLFSLYTESILWGRTREVHECCYVTCIDSHEPNPVYTRKWIEFIAPLFKPPSKYVVYRELISAALLMLLYRDYKINRNVCARLGYTNITNNCHSARYSGFWNDLKATDYEELKPIVKAMKEYIDGIPT